MKPNQTVMQDLAIQLLLSLLRVRSNLLPQVSAQVSSAVLYQYGMPLIHDCDVPDPTTSLCRTLNRRNSR